MIFAFDIDGTISAKPDIFRTIMKALMKDGHEVYPLTAMQSYVASPHFEQIRIDQLKNFEIEKGVHYTDVVVCISPSLDECGALKGKFCADKNIPFMVEDTRLYSDEIKKYSPNTMCLMMPGVA